MTHHRAALVAAVALALTGCGAETPAPSPVVAAPTTATSPTPSPTTPPTRSATPTAYEPEPFEPADRDDWLTEVPEGIRLDAALPDDGGDFTRGRTRVDFEFCGVEAFASGEVLDQRSASASGPEYGEARDLRVFADDRAAHHFLRRVAAVLAACPGAESDGAALRNELRTSHLDGDASFTAVQSFFTHDDLPVLGANFWEVVRVGNAVLLTATGGEYDPATNLDPGIRSHAAEVAGIVEEMCVFAAVPCGG